METTSSLKQPLFFQHVLRELLDAIGRVLAGDDPEADKRRRMLELSHSHPDGGSTRRLLEALGLLGRQPHGGFLHGRNDRWFFQGAAESVRRAHEVPMGGRTARFHWLSMDEANRSVASP